MIPAAQRAPSARTSAAICVRSMCHRVIGANATLTGYAGGLDRKRWLLEHEGVQLSAEQSPHRSEDQLPLFASS